MEKQEGLEYEKSILAIHCRYFDAVSKEIEKYKKGCEKLYEKDKISKNCLVKFY